jgi:hypothetical protein
MTKKNNKKELFEKLQMAVLNELIEQIDGVDDGEGNILRPSPATLNAAIKYLQNNDIIFAEESNPELEALKAKILNFRSFKDDEDECLPKSGGL